MRIRVGRVALLAAVGILLLAVGVMPAGAGQNQQDRWTGNWEVGNKRDTYGVMHLKLHRDDLTVTGHYGFSGGGTVDGHLTERFGRTLSAKWKEEDQRGKFEVHIPRGDTDFKGQSWRTQPSCGIFGCKQHPFRGKKL